MGIIGSAVGAGVKSIASIFGGINAAKAMKKVKGNIERQQRENEQWYDRRYNEDMTQRADAQAMIAQTKELLKQRAEAAQGRQAVMGGNEEAVAAEREVASDTLAKTNSTIAQSADARKDSIESQYRAKDAALQDSLNNLELQKAQAINNAVMGVGDAAMAAGKASPW